MEAIFALLVIATIGSGAYLALSFQSQRRAQGWRDAARAAGLTNVRMTSVMGWETKLTGEAGPLRVRLESYQHGKQEHGTRVVVGGLRHGAYELAVRAEGFATSIEKVFGDREVELGDEDFDSAGYLQGSPALIRALFDSETRSMMGELLRGSIPLSESGGRISGVRASIADGELRVEIREGAFERILPRLPAALGMLIEIGNRLVRPDDLAATIGANTRREAAPAVRLANLQLLSREYAAHAATRDALHAALGDESLEVRLHAATALGPDGRQSLLEIAACDDARDAMVARAITALGVDFPTSRAVETLQRSLDTGRTDVARACVNRLAQPGGVSTESVDVISHVLATADGDLAVTAARALAAHASEASERALVAALAHSSADVRVAAAESLGRGGTPIAVVPLREAASHHPFDGALRRASRQAIVLIQERVRGASPGQLSLATDAGGQVSLADEDERGRVSLAPPDGPGTRG